jgi:hypothetical protein
VRAVSIADVEVVADKTAVKAGFGKALYGLALQEGRLLARSRLNFESADFGICPHPLI